MLQEMKQDWKYFGITAAILVGASTTLALVGRLIGA